MMDKEKISFIKKYVDFIRSTSGHKFTDGDVGRPSWCLHFPTPQERRRGDGA